MRLENSFEVAATPERAWALLMDVPRVLPCMPGTELTETVGSDAWKAKMTVKLGPIALAFAADVTRTEVDETNRRAVLSASAQEVRGRGSGQARIESTLTPREHGTHVSLIADLTLSGAVAQYGRGMVQTVSGELVSSFASCLERQLAAPEGEEAPAPPTRPVSGLSLALGHLRTSLGRLLRPRRSRERMTKGELT